MNGPSHDEEADSFRTRIRRALRREPDPELEAEREQRRLEAAAQRTAWGYVVFAPASKEIH